VLPNYRGFQLDPFQRDAIEFLAVGHSVLVSAPTGTGKTLIADYLVDRAMKESAQIVYTAPIKALSNQKYRDYTRLHGHDAVGLITGDLVINRDAPLRIMTTEILRNMLLTGEDLSALRYVVVDEIHFLDDPDRGTVWEEMLIYLPPEVQVLGLSATLANLDEFADWLGQVRGRSVQVVTEEQRAVPLTILLANRSTGLVSPRAYEQRQRRWFKSVQPRLAKEEGRQRRRGRRDGQRNRKDRQSFPETSYGHIIDFLANDDLLPCLYFCFSRKLCELFSKGLSRNLGQGFLSDAERERVAKRIEIFDRQFPKVMDGAQETMYLQGIAYHHAGLHVGLKALVEELYEDKLVQVLFCTSTFALGLNMPARTVVFHELEKFNGRAVVPLTVRQFMQKAGRAGRRGMDQEGFVVLRQDFQRYHQHKEAIGRYLKGRHERVNSSFNLSFNSVVNLLDRHPLDEIRSILERSFLSYVKRREGRAMERRATKLERRIADEGWSEGDALPPRKSPLRRLIRNARRERKRHAELHDGVWRVFQAKLQALVEIGYIAEDLSLNAGGRVLRHVQIEEIFATELVLSGQLETLDEPALFGVLCALCNDFPRSARVRRRPRGEEARLAKELRRIRFGSAVVATETFRSEPITFCPEMIPFGIRWYQGVDLVTLLLEIDSAADLSGDLVTGFRRAKDLASQLKDVYRVDPAMSERLRTVMKTVSRDEVEVID
jgi:ATP-dependent RNA helicase HelY